MKLVFPGGEHPQVLLGHGPNRVGSDPASNIVLDRPGVMPQHCQLHVTANGIMLDVARGAAVWVNDRLVDGLIALRAGDTVAFDSVLAQLAPVTIVSQVMDASGVALPSANDDPGVTAVHQVLPKYVLRDVSGQKPGRSFPLLGITTVGRATDCTLRLDEPGLSRVHARLMPTEVGLQVEDLGSTNGSFINNERVLRGVATGGDEIGFDTLRFRVVASGQAEPARVDPAMPASSAGSPRTRRLAWVVTGAVVVALAVIVVVAQLG